MIQINLDYFPVEATEPCIDYDIRGTINKTGCLYIDTLSAPDLATYNSLLSSLTSEAYRVKDYETYDIFVTININSAVPSTPYETVSVGELSAEKITLLDAFTSMLINNIN